MRNKRTVDDKSVVGISSSLTENGA